MFPCSYKFTLVHFRDKDYQFLEQPSEDYFCPVTGGLLLQPHLTSCCGRHLSQEVATRLQGEGKGCPLCNETDWSTIWNKHFQRKVKSLLVSCRNKKRGCTWQGELFLHDYHVQSCPKRSPSARPRERRTHGGIISPPAPKDAPNKPDPSVSHTTYFGFGHKCSYTGVNGSCYQW